MTTPQQDETRTATTIYSAALVIDQTWPAIQDNDQLRDLVLRLGIYCGALYSGNPPLAQQHLDKLLELYRPYATDEAARPDPADTEPEAGR